MNVRYKVNRICKERDEMAQQQQITFITLIFLSGVSVLIISLLYFMWKSKVRRVSQELMQERLLRKEEESHYRLSTKNLEENEAKIKILQEQLNQAKIKNDATEITKLTLEEKALAAENLSIEAERCRSEFLIKQLKAKPLYVHIKTHAGDDKFYLTDEEWKQLGNDIDEAYNQFSSRLLSVIAVSELEMHICYLIKLGVAPKDMATMLFKSRNAITMTRQRLYKKITHKNGTAKQLDEYILAF
jgi:DNA-binding CsgD family transcriptional regulator